MNLTGNLEYRYNSSNQEIICSAEAISGIGGVLDRLGASRAMVVCGPSILALRMWCRGFRKPCATGSRDCSRESRPTHRWRCYTRPWRWPKSWNPTLW